MVPPGKVPRWTGPKLMGVKAYARHRGVSPAAVRKAIREGRIRRRKDGKIHAPTADADWAQNTAPRSMAQAPPDLPPDDAAPTNTKDEHEIGDLDRELTLTEARAAKEAYLARLRKLEYEEKAGRLVDREASDRAMFAILRTVRDRVLEIADRMCDELAAESDPSTVHEMLAAELRGTLADVSQEIARLEPAA